MTYVRFTATSSAIPGDNIRGRIVPNSEYQRELLGRKGWVKPTPEKIESVTGIKSRRLLYPDQTMLDCTVPILEDLAEQRDKPDCIIHAHDTPYLNGGYAAAPARAALLQVSAAKPGQSLAIDVLVDKENKKSLRQSLAKRYNLSYVTSNLNDVNSPADINQIHRCQVNPDSNLIMVDRQGYLAEHSYAREAAKKIGMDVDTFDIHAGCAGFLVGIELARTLIEMGVYNRIDVIGVEKLTEICDHKNLDVTIFADGGGGVRLERSDTPGIIDGVFYTDGRDGDLLKLDLGVDDKATLEQGQDISLDSKLYLNMQGHLIYPKAKEAFPGAFNELVERHSLNIEDVSTLIHQMNGRMIHLAARKIYQSVLSSERTKAMEKEAIDRFFPYIIDWTGNPSTGTIAMLFDLVFKDKVKRKYSGESFNLKLGSGQDIIAIAFGTGLTWGGIYFKS